MTGSAPLGVVEDATVRRAQSGDPAALDAVLRDLAPYLGRICGAIALDGGDDALQDTMVAVSRNLTSLREPAALRGWARRIAVRESVRTARRSASVPVDPSDLDPMTVDLSPGVDRVATAVEVWSVLDTLRPEQRAVLVLRHIDDLDEAEMAAALGVARGTVKSRLHRARAAFRDRWTA
ncbi:RNA polymerase sigma factor [Iamia sp. SCSIO 61187]|uniref:RNA polymerase sigma factor n=1 Tax=Iamia sp. SCSIO 61187 TaxID=2722752 RepID=UPI001C627DE3|nr:sigma-70 family RNA polymerase sigma factor [Iamia sp. SCSIO 61187]